MFEPLHDEPDRHEGDHRHVLVRQGQVLVRVEHTSVRSLTTDEARSLLGNEPGEVVLGRLDGVTYWVSSLPDHIEFDDRHHLEGLRGLHGRLADHEWNIGGRATQILDWYRDNQFCGRCGGPMSRASGERAMRCPDDGHTAYPRLSPAIIVLVEREDGRALLGRSGRWDTPMYSTLAGFVEPGETLEEAVQREVFEEVGVQVGDIRYVASQPWPFPNSLMLGFTARWVSGDIRVDGVEIADAQWFAPDELPSIPGKLSIARRLIDGWISRQGARP
jgi:NAD+ diphosphatase